MRLKLHVAPFWAVALMLTAFFFATSPAFAHAGHRHSQAAATQYSPSVAQPPAFQRTTALPTVANAEVTTAGTLPSTPSSNSDCDGCAYCASGPCTTCHSAVLASSPVPIPPFISVTLAAGDARSPANLHDGRLRRPPKFFA
jgi:hypothetical protein